MTDYGPPGAPQRWRGEQPGDGTGRAGRPHESPYGSPVTWHDDGHRPEPAPSDPVRPGVRTHRAGRGRMITVLAFVAVLVPAVGAAVVYLAGSDEPAPVTALPSMAAITPGDGMPAGGGTTGDGTPGQPVAPPTTASALAPESSADPRFATVGQCVRNDGPVGGRPKLAITECAPDTYEVLRRFDGATSGETDAETKCGRVEGYTDWYFHNSELDTLDFVLCLRENTP